MTDKKRVRGKARPKANHLVDRERLLREFNMITEDDLAILFGVEIKTLKNKPKNELPRFTKAGGKRLFFKTDVEDYMRRRM